MVQTPLTWVHARTSQEAAPLGCCQKQPLPRHRSLLVDAAWRHLPAGRLLDAALGNASRKAPTNTGPLDHKRKLAQSSVFFFSSAAFSRPLTRPARSFIRRPALSLRTANTFNEPTARFVLDRARLQSWPVWCSQSLDDTSVARAASDRAAAPYPYSSLAAVQLSYSKWRILAVAFSS